MANRSMFVGMDVHKESIGISIAEEGRTGEVRPYGVIAGDLEPLDNVVRALRAPQLRLTPRFRRLVARGKAEPRVATAVARELTGVIWAIAQEVPPPAA